MKRTFCLVATMALIFFSATTQAKQNNKIKEIRLDYIQEYIEEASAKVRVEPALLRAIVKVESGFNHKAKSRVGAKGLMQLMPFTAKELGNKKALDHTNPRANVLAGARYLRFLINEFEGNLVKAVAAYNAGPNAVKKYNGVPPYQETQDYVRKVMREIEVERKIIATNYIQ